jgi:hypothetical protein
MAMVHQHGWGVNNINSEDYLVWKPFGVNMVAPWCLLDVDVDIEDDDVLDGGMEKPRPSLGPACVWSLATVHPSILASLLHSSKISLSSTLPKSPTTTTAKIWWWWPTAWIGSCH